MLAKNSLRRIGTPGVVSLALVLGIAGRADAEAVNLFIKNGDTQPVKVTLSNENSNCYESEQTALGQVWNIAPGDQVKMFFWRVGGHGCNGHQGEFELLFDPPDGENKRTHFDYDSHGGLEVTRGKDYPNIYRGQLVPSSPQGDGDKTYTYVTPLLHPLVTAGKSVGHWIEICQNLCNYQHVHTLNNTTTTTKTYTSEERNSISSSLESNLELKGFGSLKASITAESARTIGRTMSESFQSGETFTDADNYVFTPEQMIALNIRAIWQWAADVSFSDHSTDTIRSRLFTCTPNGVSPNYLPGSPEDLKACSGGH